MINSVLKGKKARSLKNGTNSTDYSLFYNRDERQGQSQLNFLQSVPPAVVLKHIKVVDRLASSKSSNWMNAWDEFFKTFQIPHLRSPFTHHSDISDQMLLWYYGRVEKRMDEFTSLEIEKEDLIDQDPRIYGNGRTFRGPFLLPGTTLFRDFVEDTLVKRYELENLVEYAIVAWIEPVLNDKKDATLYYNVYYDDGSIVKARNVVVATGNSGAPKNIPDWATDYYINDYRTCESCRIIHAFDLGLNFDAYLGEIGEYFPSKDRPLEDLSIMIIGGGLTRQALNFIGAI